MNKAEIDRLSSMIIRAAISVHREMGPGLLESIYQGAMVIELGLLGIRVCEEVPIEIMYRGQAINSNILRLDLLVDDTVIVELKSVEQILPVHKKQILSYLRLAKKPLGLLINFNVPLLKEGIVRIINSPHQNTLIIFPFSFFAEGDETRRLILGGSKISRQSFLSVAVLCALRGL
jgi:GxxExxY protein